MLELEHRHFAIPNGLHWFSRPLISQKERQPDTVCLLMGDLITTHEVISPNKLSLNLIKTLNPNTNLPKIQRNRVQWEKNTTGV